MDTIANALADCGRAADAIVIAGLALTATGLAVMGFALAYIVRQLRTWRAWTKDD